MLKQFLHFLPALFKRNINVKFLLASLKILTDSKNCSENRIKFLFRLFLLSLVDFLQCAFMPGLEHFSESQAAYGTIFGVTGSYQKAGTSP